MHNLNPLVLLQKQSRLDDEPLELDRVKESIDRKTQTFFYVHRICDLIDQITILVH